MTIRLETDPRHPLGYRLVNDDPTPLAQESTSPTALTRAADDSAYLEPTSPLDGTVRGSVVENARVLIEAFEGGAWHPLPDTAANDVTVWSPNDFYNAGDIVIAPDGDGGWLIWRAAEDIPPQGTTPSTDNGWEPVGGGGGSGFTFVQDTMPTAKKIGDTWFNSSDANGGGSFVAIDRGGGVLVWVQTAPPSSAPGLTYPTFVWSNYTGGYSQPTTFNSNGFVPINTTGTDIVQSLPSGWTVGNIGNNGPYVFPPEDGIYAMHWYWEKASEGLWDNYAIANNVLPPPPLPYSEPTFPTAPPAYEDGAWGSTSATLRLFRPAFGFYCVCRTPDTNAAIYSVITVTRLDA